MAEVLLTSERFVKEQTSINDNINAKYLRPSIREAQEQNFKSIVGGCLLAKLKELIAENAIELPENIWYKDLLEHAQWYISYVALQETCIKVSYKIGNLGVAKTADTNVYNASQDEISKLRYYYQAKADGVCYEMQQWLLENLSHFPELSSCQCGKIRSNLRSAATCGIWLGGARGKVIRGGDCCEGNLGRRVL